MLPKYLSVTIAAAGALLLSTAITRAQTSAYDAAVQPGNQDWPGNLGLDFDVNTSVVVWKLGAFDSNADGFVGSVKVAIFNRDTAAQVGSSVTLTGVNGALVNGGRFIALSPGIILPPGHYSVVAVGFSASDMNGNSTLAPPFTASAENTGGGLISFVGTGRYDANTTLDYPAIVPAGTPSNVFLAGSFQFSAITAAPTLTKSFSTPFAAGSINQGETTALTFTAGNPNAIPLTGVGFSDTLPAGLLVQDPNGLTGSCGGGTITALPGGNSISLSGATLPSMGSCTFGVKVTGISGGAQNNVTSTITSNEAPPGTPASASVFVNSWWLWFFY